MVPLPKSARGKRIRPNNDKRNPVYRNGKYIDATRGKSAEFESSGVANARVVGTKLMNFCDGLHDEANTLR